MSGNFRGVCPILNRATKICVVLQLAYAEQKRYVRLGSPARTLFGGPDFLLGGNETPGRM